MDFNFILLFIDSAFLQLPDFLGGEGRQALGSDDPMVKGHHCNYVCCDLDLVSCLIFSILQLEKKWLIKQN